MQKTSENTLNSNFLEHSAPTQEKAEVFYLNKLKKHKNVFKKHASKQEKKVIRSKNTEQLTNNTTKPVYSKNIPNYESETTTTYNSACSKNIPQHSNSYSENQQNIQNQSSTIVDPKCPVAHDPLNHELYNESEYLSLENVNLYGNNSTLSDEQLAAAGETQYLAQTTNCQVTNLSIRSLAASLVRGKTTTMSKAVSIFNWVRDHIGYSFYYNTKYGAVGTLNKRTGNCVDTTHLLIALLRVAGIPSRYVHGNCQFSSGNWYGHVWAQIYINGVWYSGDASSSRNVLGGISSWNTRTFTLKGTYASLPF